MRKTSSDFKKRLALQRAAKKLLLACVEKQDQSDFWSHPLSADAEICDVLVSASGAVSAALVNDRQLALVMDGSDSFRSAPRYAVIFDDGSFAWEFGLFGNAARAIAAAKKPGDALRKLQGQLSAESKSAVKKLLRGAPDGI